MALKHTYSLSIRNDAGSGVVDSYSFSADAEENFSDVAAASSTKEIDLVVTVANIESFFIEADQDVTLKVNSTGSPTPSVALTKGQAFYWNSGLTGTNPLTTNITKLYFVNAGIKDANVKGGFLLNQGV